MCIEKSNIFEGLRLGEEIISAVPSSMRSRQSTHARSFFILKNLKKKKLKIDPIKAIGADIIEKIGMLFGPTLTTILMPAAYDVICMMRANKIDFLNATLVKLPKHDSCTP